MPSKPRYPCDYPGCPNLKPCPVHRKRRTSVRSRGYDATYDRLAKECKQRDPICVRCGRRRSQIAHHIIPLPQGEHSLDNLVGVCRKCHGQIHAAMEAKR